MFQKLGKRKFNTYLKDNSGFLQEVSSHVGSYNLILFIKTDFCVFPKPTTIVIAGGLGISDGLKKHNSFEITTLKDFCLNVIAGVFGQMRFRTRGEGLIGRGRSGERKQPQAGREHDQSRACYSNLSSVPLADTGEDQKEHRF